MDTDRLDDETVPDWTPEPGTCAACGVPLGEGPGHVRPARGTDLCLECAHWYDPPTDPPDAP